MRFYTFRKNVPLKAGQIVAFLRGKGYWARNRATPGPRVRLARLMDDLVAHEPQVHYAEIRPMRAVNLPRPVYPLTMDCSETVTCLYKWAGLEDPNGNDFNGSGYTGTLMAHGEAVAGKDAKVGDLVIFGPFPGHHVCMVREPGDDPLLFSHGMERGPLILRLSEEQTYQPRPGVFRDYL